MKLSARNQLSGTVVAIEKGAVNGIVAIEVAPGLVITSSITNTSIEELGGRRGHQGILGHGGRGELRRVEETEPASPLTIAPRGQGK